MSMSIKRDREHRARGVNCVVFQASRSRGERQEPRDSVSFCVRLRPLPPVCVRCPPHADAERP
eukprot:11168401-Lingulodinium_polyedra.AAC.1